MNVNETTIMKLAIPAHFFASLLVLACEPSWG